MFCLLACLRAVSSVASRLGFLVLAWQLRPPPPCPDVEGVRDDRPGGWGGGCEKADLGKRGSRSGGEPDMNQTRRCGHLSKKERKRKRMSLQLSSVSLAQPVIVCLCCKARRALDIAVKSRSLGGIHTHTYAGPPGRALREVALGKRAHATLWKKAYRRLLPFRDIRRLIYLDSSADRQRGIFCLALNTELFFMKRHPIPTICDEASKCLFFFTFIPFYRSNKQLYLVEPLDCAIVFPWLDVVFSRSGVRVTLAISRSAVCLSAYAPSLFNVETGPSLDSLSKLLRHSACAGATTMRSASRLFFLSVFALWASPGACSGSQHDCPVRVPPLRHGLIDSRGWHQAHI
jgi:hypothetical protein